MIAVSTVGGLVHPEEIEEMDGELPDVIEDLDRVVNVEAKKSGKNSLPRIGDSPSSVVSCRAWIAAWEARICQDRLPFGPRLYERHPKIYPKSYHGLGRQSTGRKEYTTQKYLLDLRPTWNRQNIVSSFDL